MPKVPKRQRNAVFVRILIAQEQEAIARKNGTYVAPAAPPAGTARWHRGRRAAVRRRAAARAASFGQARRGEAVAPTMPNKENGVAGAPSSPKGAREDPRPRCSTGRRVSDASGWTSEADTPRPALDWAMEAIMPRATAEAASDEEDLTSQECLPLSKDNLQRLSRDGEGRSGAAPAQQPLMEAPPSWCDSEDGASECSDSDDDASCHGSAGDSTEVPLAECAWEYPFSRNEKQMRLIMLLDRERVAAREEVRRLRKLSLMGEGGCLDAAPRQVCESPRSGVASSPRGQSCGGSPAACCASEGGRGRSASPNSCRSGPTDCAGAAERLNGPLPAGSFNLVSSMDYPFSRSEKQMLLTRLLSQEREAAEREARILREKAPWTPRGNVATSCSRC